MPKSRMPCAQQQGFRLLLASWMRPDMATAITV
jgi:hypothetical protein